MSESQRRSCRAAMAMLRASIEPDSIAESAQQITLKRVLERPPVCSERALRVRTRHGATERGTLQRSCAPAVSRRRARSGIARTLHASDAAPKTRYTCHGAGVTPSLPRSPAGIGGIRSARQGNRYTHKGGVDLCTSESAYLDGAVRGYGLHAAHVFIIAQMISYIRSLDIGNLRADETWYLGPWLRAKRSSFTESGNG